MALVAAYGSDSSELSDNISDDDEVLSCNYRNQQNPVPAPELHQSTSDSDDDEVEPVKLDEPDKLPNPLADTGERIKKRGQTEISESSSVFVTSYELKEKAKIDLLEKHVKVSDAPVEQDPKKKICWKYRKGQCPYGKKCKYSHSGPTVKNTDSESGNSSQPQTKWQQLGSDRDFNSEEPVDDDNYMANRKRKVKSGVPKTSLVPPKKAMSALNKLRNQERPWTIDN